MDCESEDSVEGLYGLDKGLLSRARVWVIGWDQVGTVGRWSRVHDVEDAHGVIRLERYDFELMD